MFNNIQRLVVLSLATAMLVVIFTTGAIGRPGATYQIVATGGEIGQVWAGPTPSIYQRSGRSLLPILFLDGVSLDPVAVTPTASARGLVGCVLSKTGAGGYLPIVINPVTYAVGFGPWVFGSDTPTRVFWRADQLVVGSANGLAADIFQASGPINSPPSRFRQDLQRLALTHQQIAAVLAQLGRLRAIPNPSSRERELAELYCIKVRKSPDEIAAYRKLINYQGQLALVAAQPGVNRQGQRYLQLILVDARQPTSETMPLHYFRWNFATGKVEQTLSP